MISLLRKFRTWRERRNQQIRASAMMEFGTFVRWSTNLLGLATAFVMCIEGAFEFGSYERAAPHPLPFLFPLSCWLGIAWAIAFLLHTVAILTRRLQCSLLEFLATTIAIASLEGLMLTTPGVTSNVPLTVFLALGIPTAILEGTIEGIVEARLLGVTRTLPRLAIIVVDWFGPAGIFSAIAGGFLWAGQVVRPIQIVFGSDMAAAGRTVCIASLIAVIPGGWIGVIAKRRARKILEQAPEAAQAQIAPPIEVA